MPGRNFLKDGAPRLLGNHGGREGKAYRKAYDALLVAYGPFLTDHVCFEAGRVALARMQLEHWSRELALLQRKRRYGRGRRPNDRQVERIARRQGLADGTYVNAVRRLEELIARTGHGDLAKQIADDMQRRHEHEASA